MRWAETYLQQSPNAPVAFLAFYVAMTERSGQERDPIDQPQVQKLVEQLVRVGEDVVKIS